MSIATSAPLPALLLAVVTALTVAGCGINVTLDDDTTRRIERDIVAVDALTALELRTTDGAVEVRGGGGDEIAVRTVLTERFEGDAEYSIDTDGDRLVVTGECDGGWFERCSVGFIVTVPGAFDVDVETDNGRIEVTDIDGTVRIETDNGAIEATGLGAATADARTDNGRIVLGFDVAPTDVEAHTDNGAIAVRVPADDTPYEIEAHSDNGSVDIDVPTEPGAARRVHVSSDNGAIDVEPRSR